MSNWEGHLSAEMLAKVRRALTSADMASNSMLDVLLKGLRPGYRGTLSGDGMPANARLMVQLGEMNRVHNLRNGDVPLAQWLRAAISLAEDKPEADALEEALRAVNGATQAPPASRAAPPATADLSTANWEITPEAQVAGGDDTLSVRYLQRGLDTAESVAKLLVVRHVDGEPDEQDGGEPLLVNGTGWLITPDLVITNHHVVNARRPGEATASDVDFRLQAENTRVLFDYFDDDAQTAVVATGDGALMAADPELDFAILRLPAAQAERPGLKLRRRLIKKRLVQALGTRVNVLQHPNGNPMRLGFRDNFVVFGDADILSYLTDTDSGSSGSPVCDDAWKVAALHSGSRGVSDQNIVIRGRKVRVENIGTPVLTIMEKLEADHPGLHAEISDAQA